MRTRKPWTPLSEPLSWEEESGRNDPAQRYRIYTAGRDGKPQLVATTGSEAGVGVAICTLGREGEFEGACVGVLDSRGEKGQRWLALPWSAMDNL